MLAGLQQQGSDHPEDAGWEGKNSLYYQFISWPIVYTLVPIHVVLIFLQTTGSSTLADAFTRGYDRTDRADWNLGQRLPLDQRVSCADIIGLSVLLYLDWIQRLYLVVYD